MAKTKDLFDDLSTFFDSGGGGDFVDNWDPGVMGDPGAFGLDPNLADIFANWGGGAGGDGTDGSGDFNAGGGSSGGSGVGSLWGQISRLFGGSGGNGGGGNGSSGGDGLMGLLPYLALIGGGINQHGATNDATNAMLQANQNAMNYLQGQQGGQRFQPWVDAGTGALSRMASMPPSDLASRFKPLGSGRAMNTLGSLAGRR